MFRSWKTTVTVFSCLFHLQTLTWLHRRPHFLIEFSQQKCTHTSNKLYISCRSGNKAHVTLYGVTQCGHLTLEDRAVLFTVCHVFLLWRLQSPTHTNSSACTHPELPTHWRSHTLSFNSVGFILLSVTLWNPHEKNSAMFCSRVQGGLQWSCPAGPVVMMINDF